MCQNKRAIFTKTSIHDQRTHTIHSIYKKKLARNYMEVIYDLNLAPLFISMCTYNMAIARLCAHFSFSPYKYKKAQQVHICA